MSTRENIPAPVRRAALYIRVSTDEQARHGYSLGAQKEDLEEYAKRHGYAIVDYYIDDGASARKRYTTRKELVRLLEDVKAGKIDLILFIKLDRWIRNVADYYKVQEILDAHHVAWKATREEYDTETTNGRLYLNIHLSIAQNESDATGDRIRYVNEAKVARGEAVCWQLPIGLKVTDKRVVPNEQAYIVRELFRHYEAHGSIYGAFQFIKDTYGVLIYDHVARKMLSNPLYKGQYRNNTNYCEAIIPPDEFDRVQEMLKARSVRNNPTGIIYLFSGLVICSECGQRMAGRQSRQIRTIRGRQYHYHYHGYMCRKATIYHDCVHRSIISEKKLETWLLENIIPEIERYQSEFELAAAANPRPKVDRAAILRKLERLKDLYVNDMIDMETYRADYEKYSAQLAQERETPPPDFSAIKDKFNAEFVKAYQTWDRSQRRDFWRGVISAIYLDAENTPRIKFK